jgi:hypothetical protein
MANIFTTAKEIQKKHPRMKWQDAVAKAGKQIKAGNKVSGVRKKPARKKAVVAAKPKAKAAKKPEVKSNKVTVRIGGCLGAVNQAKKINKDIDKLEADLKKIKSKDLRKVYIRAINVHHDKLDAIRKSL